MPDYYVDNDLCYCSLCDRYFPSEDVRALHIRFARNHPKCDKCDTRFANGNALRVHYTLSHRHNYCSACDRHFRSPAGLRAHIELSAIHNGDDSDSDDEDNSIDDSYEGWEDDVGLERFPEENDRVEPSVDDDVAVEPDSDYWPEDEESDFFEEDTYNGWGPVPAPSDTEDEADDFSSSPTVEKAETHTCTDACKDNKCSSPEHKTASAPGAFILSCPVCLEAASTPTSTSCGHIFCSSCIRRCLKVERSCPVCRRDANPRELRRLFLAAAA